MPIKKCSIEGKSGYKYGDSGKCYTGPDAKKKAFKQGLAVEISKETRKDPAAKKAEDQWKRTKGKK